MRVPSSTFLNLPAEKQEKLLEAATREFSKRPFHEASINQIIKDAGIPRGSFYMYFQDKEELFRYLLRGYEEQMMVVIERLLIQKRGDIFEALLAVYDYARQVGVTGHLGEMGTLSRIVSCNQGMQRSSVLELLDPERILARLGAAIDRTLLDLRQERDLPCMLGILLLSTMPIIYSGLQNSQVPGEREHLKNILAILRRGMGAASADLVS